MTSRSHTLNRRKAAFMFDSRMATTPDATAEPPSAGLAPPECRRRPPFERIALALQGGGALGAYQAGVYQALAEADLHPDWVAGISIGAINAAIIAGNPPESRVDKLREFWELVSSPQMQWLEHSIPVPSGGAMEGNRPDVSPLLKGDLARSLLNQWLPPCGGARPGFSHLALFRRGSSRTGQWRPPAITTRGRWSKHSSD
jgi:Patatin-like phospholipase